ncbi:lipoprotein-releasing ABC transporter permease subunit LolC [Vibrio viridaestus]|uniref:Lipoprotein-releasing ABC transporter permease subunit LolC n=1 Tax=Vibrio viridaestus TaxID=2487322 RepID=A0A3N9U1D7_9VIBR|nr:lipoprotein-releasing ABC transporter permease subunit LolC [Vibrio viridaestus]RQW63252.1 lipoprotein-releasing ABC transporter permease subunit LolC [Vibrio viridaestus]
MYHPLSIFIGLRYLKGQSTDKFSRFVSYMSTAGITIGVLSLITVLSVMNGFEAQLKQRILGVLPQAVVTQVDGKTDLSKSLPEQYAKWSVAKQPTPIVRGEAVIQSPEELSAGYMLGVDPKKDDSVQQYMIAGSLKNLEAGKYRVVLGYRLARQLNVSVGDTVRLIVTDASVFTPLGRIPSQRNFEIAGLFNTGSDVDAQIMYVNMSDAQKLLRLKENQVSGWRLYFHDPFDISSYSNQQQPDGWHWTDWRDQRGELFQAVSMEKNMMGLMLGLIIAIAAFNIISALIMVVMEKQSEVAILKTQGMTNYQIQSIFMVQGASSGVVGAIVGGLLGVIVALNLNPILMFVGADLLSFGGELPILVNPVQIFVVEVLTILLSVVATLYPSYRASTVKPAEALRYE